MESLREIGNYLKVQQNYSKDSEENRLSKKIKVLEGLLKNSSVWVIGSLFTLFIFPVTLWVQLQLTKKKLEKLNVKKIELKEISPKLDGIKETNSAITIQKFFRRIKVKELELSTNLDEKSSIIIQSFVRGNLNRKKFEIKKSSAIKIQSFIRKSFAQKALKASLKIKLQEKNLESFTLDGKLLVAEIENKRLLTALALASFKKVNEANQKQSDEKFNSLKNQADEIFQKYEDRAKARAERKALRNAKKTT